MTTRQTELIKSTWSIVAVMDPVVVGGLFYNRLFEIAPQLRYMFRSPIDEQSRKLLAMINYIVSRLDKSDMILSEITKLAKRHSTYGVKDEHYKIVGEALLWTLEKGLADKWNDETKEAWITCYTILSNTMITASRQEIYKAA